MEANGKWILALKFANAKIATDFTVPIL